MKPSQPAAIRTVALVAALLGACSSTAHAHRTTESALSPPGVAPRPAPYQVDLIDENGNPLSTYAHRGRYYVMGDAGQRYRVRVTNPTPRRVEAVISVDGLDVVDGRPADFASKRGYVIPAYGQVVIDGFRTSMDDVATFRFSSVSNSYAGRKGLPRNVGVIGVALFAEREQPMAGDMLAAVRQQRRAAQRKPVEVDRLEPAASKNFGDRSRRPEIANAGRLDRGRDVEPAVLEPHQPGVAALAARQ
jgi:hypothetical protein